MVDNNGFEFYWVSEYFFLLQTDHFSNMEIAFRYGI